MDLSDLEAHFDMESHHGIPGLRTPGPLSTNDNEADELDRSVLLQKLKDGLYPSDFLKRVMEEKGSTVNSATYKAISGTEESKEQKKFEEDTRLDYLLRMNNTLNEKFENSAYVHPHGLTEYDNASIPANRRKGLENYKMKIRKDNYVYMNLHPDIDAMMSLFLQKLVKAQPLEPVKFAGEFFTLRGTTHTDFLKLIEEEKKKLHRYHTQKTYTRKENTTGHSHSSGHNAHSHMGFRRKSWQPKKLDQGNHVKKLGLGALALDFSITPPPSRASFVDRLKATKVAPVDQVARTSIPIDETPGKKYYCGCKDPGRRERSHRNQKKIESEVGLPLLFPLSSEMEGEGYYEDEEEEGDAYKPNRTRTVTINLPDETSEEEEEFTEDSEN